MISNKKPCHSLSITCIFILAVFFGTAGTGLTACQTAPHLSTEIPTTRSGQLGFINVYFTDPDHHRDGTLPSEALKNAFDQAEKSIDLAIYSFNDPVISKTLIQAYKRGVTIRVVMEDENAGKTIPLSLESAGIPLVSGNQDGLMHNKFALIDGDQLWMGSVNLTTYGFYTDNNYLVEIQDPDIAQAYRQEFDEMYTTGLFGRMNEEPSPQNDFQYKGREVEIYFSPEDHIAEKLITLIDGSQKSIHFLTSSFTLDNLANAMLSKSALGVDVRGVFDESSVSSNEGTEYDRLRRAGLDVHLDGIEGLMHEKLLLIDGNIVIIGSYNYTASADDRNDENLMIIHDPDLAQLFEDEFQRILKQSQP